MKVSPNTAVDEPAGAMPKRQTLVPSASTSGLPLAVAAGRTSSLMGTEIVGEEKVKFKVVVLSAKEQGTKAAPFDEEYCADTCS